MDLVIPIGANVLLGLILLAIFAGLRPRDGGRLSGPEEAMVLFRQHFHDASGPASVSDDGRSALIALRPEPGIGLLHQRGRRWNARALHAQDLRTVRSAGDSLVLTFADFGWPRIRIALPDAQARTLWLVRLNALAAGGVASGPSAGAAHA